MLFFILNFALQVLARQIEIEPKSVFEFYEYLAKGELYKLEYNTKSDMEVALFDPLGREIYKETVKHATVFTEINNTGKIKISVRNKNNTPVLFSYKSPDPNKEVLGEVGYVKNVNLVSELTRLLDELINTQREQIKRTSMQQQMVRNSRIWVKTLIAFETVMTAVGVYIIHKSFVSMFEKKQNI